MKEEITIDIKNWLTQNVVSNTASSKQKDMEILTSELEVYADWGQRCKQIKLPDGGSYLVTGWFTSMQDGRSNVRLSRVPVDRDEQEWQRELAVYDALL